MNRRAVILGLVLALVGAAPAPLAGADEAAEGGPAPAILELFTSQGCSSCPPADALLGEFARQNGIVALTLPVDYWDYLGWRDTLARPANSERQRAYARARGDRAVYTPQVVVNGLYHAAGHKRDAIAAAIDKARHALAGEQVPVALSISGNSVLVRAGAARDGASHRDATLWLVLYSRVKKVDINRGENAGRTVTYYNVVREMSPIGMWHGAALDVELPKGALMGRGYDGCAALLQAGAAGPIIGAAMLAGR